MPFLVKINPFSIPKLNVYSGKSKQKLDLKCYISENNL